jgi:hypothetical protein
MSGKVARWWDDFFFRPVAPTRLGIVRSLYYTGLLWVFFGRPSMLNPNYVAQAHLPDEFQFPLSFFHFLPIADPEQLGQLTLALKIVLPLAAIGFCTRITSALVFVLIFYLLSIPGMYGRLVLINAIPIVVTFLLAASRCGDAFSVDRLIRDRWSRWPFASAATTPSGHYRWPVQAVCMYLTLTFSLAGASKLITSGISWALSDNLSTLLRTTLKEQGCFALGGGGRIPELANWLADQRVLCQVAALGVLTMELFAPVVLFLSGLPRFLVLAGMLTSSLAFYFFVGPDAWPVVLVMLFFVPWDELLARFRPSRAAPNS